MSKHRFLVFMGAVFVAAMFALSPGNVLAEKKPPKDPNKQTATLDDQAKKFGKMTRSEQKAAAMRNRDLGLLPGNAGRTPQTPGAGAPR